MRKHGIPKFECSVSESSDAELQGNVKEKKKHSSWKDNPGFNTSCKQGGNSGSTKKHPQESKKKQEDRPPPKMRRRESSN